MNAAAPMQMLLFLAVGGTGAMCGFIASAVVLRNKRRARGYFVLGVLTGLVAATIGRRRYRKLTAFGTLARELVRR
jgi:uncharacterized membrane protein YeaQ/YmgE (transglycosylase-associated protein family)